MSDRRVERAIILSLTVLALATRLHRIDALPPGLHFDEAHNGLDAQAILDGARPVFLPTNDGR